MTWLVALVVLMAAEPAAVTVDGEQLWLVRAPRAGLSATERAREIEASIAYAATDPHGTPKDAVLDSETILLLGRSYIFSVTDEDARLEGRSRVDLFAERKALVLATAARYRERRAVANLARSAALAAVALVAGAVALMLLRRLYRRMAAWGHKMLSRRTRHGENAGWFRAFEGPLVALLRWGSWLAFFLVASIVVFAIVSYTLGLFAATRAWGESLTQQARQAMGVTAEAILNYLPNLAVLVATALVTFALVRLSAAFARAIEQGALNIHGFHREWAQPTHGLLRLLLMLFGLVVAFPYLPGGESPALKGASIFVGVLVSLGSGSAMGNAVAGVILTYMRPFRVGDRVQIADTTGDVMEKTLLVTRVRTIKNVEVIVPNSAILGTHIMNYSAQAQDTGLILHTTITLGYDAPWRTVHELMKRAALRTIGIEAEPRPFVWQTALNDYNVSYELNAYTREANRMAELYSELHRNMLDEFNAAGVEILSPAYLAMRDGNKSTIPEVNGDPGKAGTTGRA